MIITVTVTRKLTTVDHSKKARVQFDTHVNTTELLQFIQLHIGHYCKIELERN